MIISLLNRYRIAQYISLAVLLALVFLASILGHALVAKNRILEDQVRQIDTYKTEVETLRGQVEQLQGQVHTLEQEKVDREAKVVPTTTPLPLKTPISEKKAVATKAGEGSGVTATWYNYGLKSDPNYSRNNATCASRDYPRGTKLKVTNIATGASVICVVNDYGPQAKTGHAIDLSSYAFKQLQPLSTGVIKVRIEQI